MTQILARKKHGIPHGSRLVDVLIVIAVAVICLFTLYPMYYVFIMSISKPQDVLAMNVSFWPTGFELQAYKKIFTDSDMWRAYGNSILYTVSTTVLVIITSVMGAYPLSVPELRGRKYVVAFVLLPMYFGGGLIPTFLLMSKLNLYNNIFAIIVPASFNIWYIILTRTYFTGLPRDIPGIGVHRRCQQFYSSAPHLSAPGKAHFGGGVHLLHRDHVEQLVCGAGLSAG